MKVFPRGQWPPAPMTFCSSPLRTSISSRSCDGASELLPRILDGSGAQPHARTLRGFHLVIYLYFRYTYVCPRTNYFYAREGAKVPSKSTLARVSRIAARTSRPHPALFTHRSDDELLNLRMCDLGLSLEGSW